MTNICYLLIHSSGGSLHFFIDDSLFKLVVLEKKVDFTVSAMFTVVALVPITC